MKRLFSWVAGAAGGLLAYRAVKGTRHPQPAAGADDRAAELKVRLQQAREATVDRVELQPDEAVVDEAESRDPQARRAQVHEQGRAALDEMRGDQS